MASLSAACSSRFEVQTSGHCLSRGRIEQASSSAECLVNFRWQHCHYSGLRYIHKNTGGFQRVNSVRVSKGSLKIAVARHSSDDPASMGFFERLTKAWSILFPSQPKEMTVRQIAKQRLQVILASDRCAVSEETQKRIVNNIVEVLSDFVEIEAQERVHLDVSADQELGTIYSVTVPVRRVKLGEADMYWYEGIKEKTFSDYEKGGQLVASELRLDATSLVEEGSGAKNAVNGQQPPVSPS